MISRLLKTVNATDNLYLTPPQQKDVLDYAKSLPRRFAAARAVQSAEDQLVDAAVRALEAGHPDLGPPAEFGWDAADDDLRLAIRAVVHEMLTDDTDAAESAVLDHLLRTLDYLGVPPAAAAALFTGLRDGAMTTLPPDSYELLAPHFDRAVALTAGEAVAA